MQEFRFYLHIFWKALKNKPKTEWLHLFCYFDLNNLECLGQWLKNWTIKKWYCQCSSLRKFIFRTGKNLYSYNPVWSNTFMTLHFLILQLPLFQRNCSNYTYFHIKISVMTVTLFGTDTLYMYFTARAIFRQRYGVSNLTISWFNL